MFGSSPSLKRVAAELKTAAAAVRKANRIAAASRETSSAMHEVLNGDGHAVLNSAEFRQAQLAYLDLADAVFESPFAKMANAPAVTTAAKTLNPDRHD